MSIGELRKGYHSEVCRQILGFRRGVPNIADVGSKRSKALAESMIKKIGLKTCPKPPSGQTAGARFAEITKDFLSSAFQLLAHLRPGNWTFSTSQTKEGIGVYEQYRHLSELMRVLKKDKELAATLATDYLVTPDIVIGRKPVPDAEFNRRGQIVNGDSALLTPLRERNNPESRPIFHASISCKWTVCSDRAQNTRTEALNLIRNRKGKTPHIAVVVAEPMPTRLASLALGTGDIDCVYHIALPQLTNAAQECGFEDQLDMLQLLVDGRRLRDIADLPFDLIT